MNGFKKGSKPRNFGWYFRMLNRSVELPQSHFYATKSYHIMVWDLIVNLNSRRPFKTRTDMKLLGQATAWSRMVTVKNLTVDSGSVQIYWIVIDMNVCLTEELGPSFKSCLDDTTSANSNLGCLLMDFRLILYFAGPNCQTMNNLAIMT